jgi:HPt (histidine-containing phosphotransfer) domain-containing protein
MAQLAAKTVDQAPAAPAAAIDRGQLSRMTFGDRSLEREVLQLFDRQAGLLLARMHSAEAGAVATLAHTLKGSAMSIGATDVELAAAAVERAAGTAERTIAVGRLATAIEAACAEIATVLSVIEG